MCDPIYQYDDFEDEYEYEEMTYRRQKRLANPNLNRENKFSNLNRIGRFPYSNYGREEGYPSPNEYRIKVDISSFSENLDIESFLDWICEVDKFFDMAYIPIEKQVKFVVYKLKGGVVHDGINCKSQGDVKTNRSW